MYLASKSFSSMKLGARYPAQTTKISAEAKREALGLVASTLSKNFLKTHMRDWKSVERKTLVTKYPPSRRKEQASLRATSTSSHWLLASLLQLAPTLGAPSLSTTSHFCPLVSFLSCSQQDWVVMSPWKLTVPGTRLMGSRSTPTMVEFMGMHSLATCIHPPGAAQRSMRTLAVPRKLYLRLSWMSLYAARERYPCCLAKWQQASSLLLDLVFLAIVDDNQIQPNRKTLREQQEYNCNSNRQDHSVLLDTSEQQISSTIASPTYRMYLTTSISTLGLQYPQLTITHTSSLWEGVRECPSKYWRQK